MPRMFLWVTFIATCGLAACQSSTTPAAKAAGFNPSQTTSTAAKASKSFSSQKDAGVIITSWASKDVLALMSDADRSRNRQAETRALTGPLGQQVTWKNGDSGHSGNIVPLKDRYSTSGLYCRDFQQAVLLGDIQRKGASTACQGHNGAWSAPRVSAN